MKLLIGFAAAFAIATAAAALPPSTFSFPRHFAPQQGYNPIDDIKGWPDDKYLRMHGSAFLGSQSPTESLHIKSLVDTDGADATARRGRLDAMLILDAIAGLGAAGVWLARAARRRAASIKEVAIDAAASGLKVGRKISAGAQTLGREIKKRADS